MRFGIHLPQYGRASGAESLTRAARQAEELGFDDVWVSDHQVVPADAGYPPPYLFEPLTALTWAAAATRRVGLGTSVLVVPQHDTVSLANRLASLDQLSGGRVILGAGVGWLEGEYEALGKDFHDRGRRMDESLEVLRACFTRDPVDFEGRWHRLRKIRLLPKPAHPIPIWLGGASDAACARAVRLGDGFHAIGLSPEEAASAVARLRTERPEESFVFSLRRGWDGLNGDPAEIQRELAGYREAGVQHLLAAPVQASPDDWLRSVELLAALFAEFREAT